MFLKQNRDSTWIVLTLVFCHFRYIIGRWSGVLSFSPSTKMFWLRIFHQLEFMTSCHISPSSFISNAIWDVGFHKRKGNGSENCNVSKLRIHVVCHCINNWNLSIYLRYRSLFTLEIVSWNSIDIDYKSYESYFSWCNSLSKLEVTKKSKTYVCLLILSIEI